MKFENTKVWGFEHAIRGMRNPLESWEKSDSHYDVDGNYIIGKNDSELMKKLINSGSEHRKFMRQIFVSVDITAPLYWWKEFDTYKIGTVANSTSTMHTITKKPITIDNFEMDDFYDFEVKIMGTGEISTFKKEVWGDIINNLNGLRDKYLKTKDKMYWKELIRILPESWLQKRTITMNYENVLNIYHQRRYHKLNEWSGVDNYGLPNFCKWVYTLPYMGELIFQMEVHNTFHGKIDILNRGAKNDI